MRAFILLTAAAAALRPASTTRSFTKHQSIPANAWAQLEARDENSALLFLDLRDEFERAAEQRLLTLFYAVRRIVDRGGAALPAGRAVDAVLYARATFSKADTIGAGVPCYVVEDDGALTAETADAPAAPAAVVAASDAGALEAALAAPSTAAVALPPDANLWAFALTGMRVLASEDDGETF